MAMGCSGSGKTVDRRAYDYDASELVIAQTLHLPFVFAFAGRDSPALCYRCDFADFFVKTTASGTVSQMKFKVGFDLSVADVNQAGTGVYAANLFRALRTLESDVEYQAFSW